MRREEKHIIRKTMRIIVNGYIYRKRAVEGLYELCEKDTSMNKRGEIVNLTDEWKSPTPSTPNKKDKIKPTIMIIWVNNVIRKWKDMCMKNNIRFKIELKSLTKSNKTKTGYKRLTIYEKNIWKCTMPHLYGVEI